MFLLLLKPFQLGCLKSTVIKHDIVIEKLLGWDWSVLGWSMSTWANSPPFITDGNRNDWQLAGQSWAIKPQQADEPFWPSHLHQFLSVCIYYDTNKSNVRDVEWIANAEPCRIKKLIALCGEGWQGHQQRILHIRWAREIEGGINGKSWCRSAGCTQVTCWNAMQHMIDFRGTRWRDMRSMCLSCVDYLTVAYLYWNTPSELSPSVSTSLPLAELFPEASICPETTPMSVIVNITRATCQSMKLKALGLYAAESYHDRCIRSINVRKLRGLLRRSRSQSFHKQKKASRRLWVAACSVTCHVFVVADSSGFSPVKQNPREKLDLMAVHWSWVKIYANR